MTDENYSSAQLSGARHNGENFGTSSGEFQACQPTAPPLPNPAHIEGFHEERHTISPMPNLHSINGLYGVTRIGADFCSPFH